MKLRKGKEKPVYFLKGSNEYIERDVVLNKVVGKPISEGKIIVKQYIKKPETVWNDKAGEPVAYSYSDAVLEITVKPGNAEEKQKELLDNLKDGLEAISREDCSLDDIRSALKAQIAYSEFMDFVND